METPDLPKADLVKRFLAQLIDGILAAAVTRLLPYLGALVAAAYFLVRDGLELDFMDRRSIGKKLMKLRPVTLDGTPMDINLSIRRNWMFGVGYFLGILGPFLGLIASLALLVVVVLEAVLVIQDPAGRRWGDKLANTQVIEEA